MQNYVVFEWEFRMPSSSKKGDGHTNAITDRSRKTRKLNSNTDNIYRSKVELTTPQLPIELSSLLNIETAGWLIPHVRARTTPGGSYLQLQLRNVLLKPLLKTF